eukprot:UN18878
MTWNEISLKVGMKKVMDLSRSSTPTMNKCVILNYLVYILQDIFMLNTALYCAQNILNLFLMDEKIPCSQKVFLLGPRSFKMRLQSLATVGELLTTK